jgi:hypothetical protein
VNENKSNAPTPEQLLLMLDLQMEQQRALRQKSSSRRTTFRVFSIFLILGGCLAAFLVLQYALSELRPSAVSEPSFSSFEQVP